MLLFVHTDADSKDDKMIRANKIEPARQALQASQEKDFCKTMVSIVPIPMTEAWMLADTDLLKKQIGTSKTNIDL